MLIDISNLKKSYTSGVVITEVLKGIGMKVEEGEIGEQEWNRKRFYLDEVGFGTSYPFWQE